jgi:hypothetical protein
VQKTKDANGLTAFFYLVQDLKCLVFSLVNLHFRVLPSLLRLSRSEVIVKLIEIIYLKKSGLGKHRFGFVVLILPVLYQAVRLVKVVLPQDQLEALIPREQLAQLNAALVLGVPFVIVVHYLHLVLVLLVVLGLLSELVLSENDRLGDYLFLLLAGEARARLLLLLL